MAKLTKDVRIEADTEIVTIKRGANITLTASADEGWTDLSVGGRSYLIPSEAASSLEAIVEQPETAAKGHKAGPREYEGEELHHYNLGLKHAQEGKPSRLGDKQNRATGKMNPHDSAYRTGYGDHRPSTKASEEVDVQEETAASSSLGATKKAVSDYLTKHGVKHTTHERGISIHPDHNPRDIRSNPEHADKHKAVSRLYNHLKKEHGFGKFTSGHGIANGNKDVVYHAPHGDGIRIYNHADKMADRKAARDAQKDHHKDVHNGLTALGFTKTKRRGSNDHHYVHSTSGKRITVHN